MPITGPRIEITVHKNGETTHEVHGAQGDSCKTASRGWEALFGEVISTQSTMEAYEEPEKVEIKGQQGG